MMETPLIALEILYGFLFFSVPLEDRCVPIRVLLVALFIKTLQWCIHKLGLDIC